MWCTHVFVLLLIFSIPHIPYKYFVIHSKFRLFSQKRVGINKLSYLEGRRRRKKGRGEREGSKRRERKWGGRERKNWDACRHSAKERFMGTIAIG